MAKVMQRNIVLILLLVGGTFFAASAVASADSIGQCNLSEGNTMTSITEWQNTLSQEGVLNQAKTEVFSKGGYFSGDQSISQWMGERVMMGNARQGFSGNDYGCRDGSLFGAGHRSYPAGKEVFYVLPGKYSKSNVSRRKTKTFSKAVPLPAKVIGFPNCANPFEATITIVIYVRNSPKPKPHPKPKPIPTPVPTPTPAPVPTPTTPAPTPPPTVVNCSNVNTGSGTISSGTVCSHCVGVDVCNTETPTPPSPETCVPPTVGTPPNCKEKPYPFNLEPPQEFYPNETGVICTNVHAPKGDILKVYFHAKYGQFTEAEAFQSTAYTGENSYCERYKASSEYLPQGDKYWVEVQDITTGLSSPPETEAVFEKIPMIEESFY
jgi:hypothetical protein